MPDMPSTSLVLYRRDPERNMARFYAMTIEPTLFGDVSLVRHWGRIGTRGRQKVDLFAESTAAEAALVALRNTKLRRGYHH
ncbi:putative DNA-binding WGR domain protein [Aminobacter niigataensis]|uniref:DNA-binding WGR domain protein n=1 Tax=Aminobacter niigataensis TaxID=83265 RepID=A0ABR6L914_9HYPH|nr:WGR domain-containing protein [Aminobacter niigataensis]MBB4653298.1 putative DNA-binding WGR domain protein [Aminobacter niigataensis]